MRNLKHALGAVLITILCSCASPKGERLNRVSVGMTKAEVISAMGTPSSTTAEGNTETLRYSVNASRALFSFDWDEYAVRLVNGKVESYGKASELKPAGPKP